MNGPTAAELDAYRVRTERLQQLCGFVSRMAPAFGESVGDGREPVDAVTPLALLRARNAAIQDAFDSIAAIARQS